MTDVAAPANLRLSRGRENGRFSDLLAAVAVFVMYLGLLLATPQMGFTRDESFYFHAARDYVGWFNELEQNIDEGRAEASFTQEGIDRHWSYNPEHPILMKTLFGLSYEHLHKRLGWLGPSTAMRFPAMVFAAFMMAFLYLFTRDVFGSRLAAWLAVLLMTLQPRFFFDAHLTCFDVPITAMWFVIVYAYWKSLDSTKWAIATGLLWGIGLITKLNAFFLPFVFLAHWAIGGLRRFDWREGRVVVPTVPLALFAMVVLGPLILHLGWPRHWYETYGRLAWYFKFHLHHEHYFVYYFGQNLIRPPFPVALPFVLTLVTMPLVTMISMLGGAALCLREWVAEWRRSGPFAGDRFGTGALIAMNIAVPILVIAMPDSPVFGGVKHWYPSIPFLCMLAGYGLSELVRRAAHGTGGRLLAGFLVTLAVAAPATLSLVRNHPFGTSYFSEPIGGLSGAADARMMRQFWGYSARQALPWLNENAPQGSRVYLVDTTGLAWDMYIEEGLLRSDLRAVWDPRQADYALYDHDKAFFHEQSEIWRAFGTYSPVHVVQRGGVPIISVYERPGTRDPLERPSTAELVGDGEANAPTDGSAAPEEPVAGEEAWPNAHAAPDTSADEGSAADEPAPGPEDADADPGAQGGP